MTQKTDIAEVEPDSPYATVQRQRPSFRTGALHSLPNNGPPPSLHLPPANRVLLSTLYLPKPTYFGQLKKKVLAASPYASRAPESQYDGGSMPPRTQSSLKAVYFKGFLVGVEFKNHFH
jgi:hypothetical protein